MALSCSSIAKSMCGYGNVFTSKEQAIACSKNVTYKAVFAAIVTVFIMIFAFFVINGVIPDDMKYLRTPIMLLIMVGGFYASFNYASSIPLREQENDEREIKKRMSRGMTRDGAIGDLNDDIDNICEAERRTRNRYGNRYGNGPQINLF